MKKLTIMITTLLLTFSAFADAKKLAEYTRFPGFEMHPVKTDITIYDDGNVYATSHIYRENKTTTVLLRELSEKELTLVTESVSNLTKESLVDRTPNLPRCTDTPSYIWKAFSPAIGEMNLNLRSSCHEYYLASKINGALADEVISVLDLLLEEYHN